jgi:hypothetical protein
MYAIEKLIPKLAGYDYRVPASGDVDLLRYNLSKSNQTELTHRPGGLVEEECYLYPAFFEREGNRMLQRLVKALLSNGIFVEIVKKHTSYYLRITYKK